eukprot:CAMPEP_0195289542 /NCGR_PEP_ID=MMETSP0707-20130614/5776_1 /TAXON_ID=33640 /ORGANISM="Asterionellopsis glacialis, Strain CCMP134" /LENGTH=359 /DNA_ID=CAMNT_0040349561 /DNA_START=248 /DNA_END=1326 /DNA_ORIENTATION=-
MCNHFIDQLAGSTILKDAPPIEESKIRLWSAVADSSVTPIKGSEKEGNDVLPQAYTTVQARHEQNLTRLQNEFRDMMNDFARFTETDIKCIRDPRLRPLYEGIVAGGREPAVYTAFEVLFEDYIPIRIAGRMIYGRLKSVIESAVNLRDMEHDTIASSTGLPRQEIASSREAFLTIADNQDDGEAFLTVEELVSTGIAKTAIELLGYTDFEEFLSIVDKDQTGILNFENLMIGLQRCCDNSCALECNIGTVLPEIAKRVGPLERNSDEKPNDRSKKYSDRYDHMVESFIEWEDIVPEGNGRGIDVLRGCFVGAKSPKIVQALKIVYMDYTAMRVAGDLIFKLVTKIVKTTKKNARRKLQ